MNGAAPILPPVLSIASVSMDRTSILNLIEQESLSLICRAILVLKSCSLSRRSCMGAGGANLNTIPLYLQADSSLVLLLTQSLLSIRCTLKYGDASIEREPTTIQGEASYATMVQSIVHDIVSHLQILACKNG